MDKPKIVVVEDEELLLKGLNVILLSAGFDVISATDGEAGEKAILDALPDCVLLDIMLPKKTGFEVLEAIRKEPKTKHIPVIILSNMGQTDEVKKGLALGAQDYFIKAETDLDAVVEKIQKYLKKK